MAAGPPKSKPKKMNALFTMLFRSAIWWIGMKPNVVEVHGYEGLPTYEGSRNGADDEKDT